MFDDFEGFHGAGGTTSINEALANTGSSYRINEPAPVSGGGGSWSAPQQNRGWGTVANVANAASQVQNGSKKEEGGGLQKILSIVGTVAAFL